MKFLWQQLKSNILVNVHSTREASGGLDTHRGLFIDIYPTTAHNVDALHCLFWFYPAKNLAHQRLEDEQFFVASFIWEEDYSKREAIQETITLNE